MSAAFVSLNAAADQAAAQAQADLLQFAATFDGLDQNLAAYRLGRDLEASEVSRQALADTVAVLALQIHRRGLR